MKPWGDDTDMDAMLKDVKAIEMEGLVWGACESHYTMLWNGELLHK